MERIIQYKKDVKLIKSFLEKTQDKKKIINNIMNGVPYVEFKFIFIIEKSILVIDYYELYSFPIFNENSFFFPKIEGYWLTDYLFDHPVLKRLSCDIELSQPYNIDVDKTMENIKGISEINSDIHNVEIKKTEDINEFLYNYNIIQNYISENYKERRKKGSGFLLDFDFSNQRYFLSKIKNIHLYKDYLEVFYLKNKQDLKTIDCLNELYFKDSDIFIGIYEHPFYVLDINKSIEKIKLINTLKNF